MMDKCEACGRAVTGDEAALYRKLICRSAEQCLCLSCLAEKLSLSEKTLLELIERYRGMGCAMFPNAEAYEPEQENFDLSNEKT